MAARHDLEGQCGKKYEEVFWGEIPKSIPCACGNPTCTAELSFAWGGMNYSAAEQSIGTVYFENPATGERMVAASSRARTPYGWVRRVTTTYHETQLLEKKLQVQDYEKSTIAREQMQAMEEMRESMERAAWRSESSEAALAAAARAERAQREQNEREEYGDSTPYRPKIQDDGARARLAKDLAEKAANEMYANRRKWSGIDTGVHLDALHNDQRR
jgi:hypothetical protein